MSAPMIRPTPKRMTLGTSAKLQRALTEKPRTVAELGELSGMPLASYTWLKKARKEGLVYRSGWTEDVRGRLFTALFSWGAGVDVPRPGGARTAAQRMADVRARRRAEQTQEIAA